MNRISHTGKTDRGKQRTNNEDAYIEQRIWDENHILGVVIDGVGGYDGGERAAEIAKETIVAYLKKHSNGERLDLLKYAVIEANNKIEDERLTKKQFPNMSCVLTACLVDVEKKRINMVHVGDTRLYQYYGNALRKLSHDHSLIGYREEIGNLTEEEAMNHPERNLINRLVGEMFHQIDDKDFIEAATFPLLPNSILLLCSDGLFDMLTSAEILSVLKQNILLKDKVKELIRLANEKGGRDNITVVLIDYSDDEPVSTKEPVNSPVKDEDKQIKTDSGRKGLNLFYCIVFMILSTAAGLIVGWFGNQKFSIPAELHQNPRDSITTKKDTLMLEINDTCTIRVIGENLEKDTMP
jgi:serine/threonine protein phosphatase PrpC